MAPNLHPNRSILSSSSSSFPTINKYAKYFDVDAEAASMDAVTIETKTTALEFSSSSSETTNENTDAITLTSSPFFYDHDYDDELDQFWKNKRGVIPFYDHDFDRDLDRYCKEQRTLFLKRLTFESLYVLKTELGYSRQEINAAYVVVETLRNQQQLKKPLSRGRNRRRRLEFNDSDRTFFLTNYNQQARMIINRAVHAAPVRC